MEISEKKEITTVEILSATHGDRVIRLRTTRVSGRVKYVTLERAIKDNDPVIPNFLYFYSLAEVRVAFELLKYIVEKGEEIGETDGQAL